MECVRIINEKIFLNDSGLSIKSKIPLLLDKYIGYYLLNNQKKIYNLASGTAQKNLNIEEFKLIKIPIPSIEKQNELIKQLDILDNSNKDAFKLIDNLKECNKIKLKNVKYNSNIEYKKLSDVCKFQNGKAIKKELLIDGEYPVIGGGKKPFGFHNEYNCFENTILCSSTGTAGFISKYNKKVWISDCFSIIPINYDYLNNNYLYHYLKSIQDKIYELQSGAVQPHVYSKDLSKLEIQIPSIDIQEEIINYCDNNLTIIENLNKSIDGNKKIMKNMINNI
jgi:type I restriction enzyme S subunit